MAMEEDEYSLLVCRRDDYLRFIKCLAWSHTSPRKMNSYELSYLIYNIFTLT